MIEKVNEVSGSVRLRATREALEHWNRIVGFVEEGDWSGLLSEEWHSESCALCALYLGQVNVAECTGCPIRDRVGETACHGTPWHITCTAFETWISQPPEEDARIEALAAARRERDFVRETLEWVEEQEAVMRPSESQIGE